VEGEEEDCSVFEREALGPEEGIEGPALVKAIDSTCLILRGQKAEVDGWGNLVIRET